MTQIKYHINNNHEVKECRANIFPCRLTQHFTDKTEAYKASEKLLQEEYELLSKIQKIDKSVSQNVYKGMLNKEILSTLNPDTQITIVSALRKMDKQDIEQPMWHAIYDTTPAGQLELKRLRTSDKGKRINKAEKIKDDIKQLDILNSINLDEYAVEMKKNDFSDSTNGISDQPLYQLKDAKKKMALVSASWMSRMTVEEIDTVHWITGHGAGILNKHLIGEEHPSAKNYTKEFLNKKAELFKSAMAKAPELDEPVVFYRGTKYKHVFENELNNVASSSYGSKVAKNFADNKPNAVIIEIKTRKVASVVAMSEWGDSEIEMLAPLGKYKKTDEFTNAAGQHIVQLEYID